MMFYPAEDEKAPYHAEPEEGQVAPELPAGLTNEPDEEDAAEEADESAEEEAAEDEESGSGQARDDQGRFVAAEPAEPAESAEAEADDEDSEDGEAPADA